MTLMLKYEVCAQLRDGKNVITPKFILHPLRGHEGKAFFYNKQTGESHVVDVKMLTATPYGKAARV